MTDRNSTFFFIIFLIWGTLTCFAQNQMLADSLIQRLDQHKTVEKDSLRFRYLAEISFNHNNPDSALYYARLLSSETNDAKWLTRARYYEGSALRIKGDLDGALEAFLKSLKLAQSINSKKSEALCFSAIADVYSVSGAHQNSIEYYSKSIPILRALKDSLRLASVLFNLGDEHLNHASLKAATPFFKESGEIFDLIHYPSGVAYNLGNIGMVYAKQGNDAIATLSLNKAIVILEGLEDYYAISEYLTYMSDIYLKRGNTSAALEYANRSLFLAKNYGLKEQISKSNLQLSQLYEQMGDQALSFKYYKDHIAFRDSVKNLESVQEMADLRTDYEVSQNQIKADYEISQKQIEVNLLNKQKKTQRIAVIASAIALFLIGLLAIALFRRNKFIEKTKKVIEEEKDRSDNLLLNILPEETAKELKDNGKVKAKKYDAVSVLFSDFKGFTSYSKNLSPEALVETINFYFSKFDEIIEKHGLEKIKTIGDAYMCAGGLNYNNEDHTQKMLLAAFEIAAFVEKTKQDGAASKLNFDIRIGINTGPVVAGVVGTKKFAYDIWGDTVNVASRMESMSEPGRINISENTYKIVKNKWDCEYRGEIEAKNRGAMKMYFVNGLKENK